MSLADVITEIENGTFDRSVNTSVTPAIEIQIREELAIASVNEARETLFSDAKILHDRIIKRYLNLNQETRQFMADVYVREDCFREKAILAYHTRKKIVNEFTKCNFSSGSDHLILLQHISHYSMLTPIIQQYLKDMKKLKKPKPTDVGLYTYLKKYSKNLAEYDFLRCTYWFNSKEVRNVFESITHQLSKELTQEVKDMLNLKYHREKILQQYLKDMKKLKKPKLADVSIPTYLKEKELKAWPSYDFVNGQTANRPTKQSILMSITHNLPSKLKQQVHDMATFKYHRQKILQQYISDTKKLKTPNPTDAILSAYLKKQGIPYLSSYDFRSNASWNDSENKRDVFASLTYDLPEQLKQRIRDMLSLKYHRKKTLKKYIQVAVSTESPDLPPPLGAFLRNNNLSSWADQNFILGRNYKPGEQRDHVKSVTHGITDKELVAKVRKYDARARKQ